MLRCWFLDDYYDVKRLETSLKKHFDLNRRIFDQTSNETRIDVIAITISNVLSYLFSNYNEIKKRKKNYDKTLLSEDLKQSLKLQITNTFVRSMWLTNSMFERRKLFSSIVEQSFTFT